MHRNLQEDEELDDNLHLVQRCRKRHYDLENKRISGDIYKLKERLNKETNRKETEEYLSVSLFEYRNNIEEIKQDMKNRNIQLSDKDIFPQLQVIDFKNVGKRHGNNRIVAKYKGGDLFDSHAGIFNLSTETDFCNDLGDLVSKVYFSKE